MRHAAAASWSRRAQLYWLQGRTQEALALSEQAASDALAHARSRSDAAWYQVQLGALLFKSGRLDEAAARSEAALAIVDGYTPALAGIAQVEAARRNADAAIALYEAAVERQPTLQHVIALGDVYAAAERPDESAAQFALVWAIEQLYAANGIGTDLGLVLFLADHDLRLDEALAQAGAAYEARPGIYAADALAWVLYKSGRHAEARGYSDEALRLGTPDALLLYHAGRIREAAGDVEGAREALRTALALNPRFSVLHADDAAATLERLEATAAGIR